MTAKKIHILGSSYKSELLKQIPAENLPKKFGGLSDPAGGVELSDEGPWTDPRFMSGKQGTSTSNIQKVNPASLQGSRPGSIHAQAL